MVSFGDGNHFNSNDEAYIKTTRFAANIDDSSTGKGGESIPMTTKATGSSSPISTLKGSSPRLIS